MLKQSPATPLRRLSVLAAATLPLLAACGGTGAEESSRSGSGPRVVASFYPLEYVAQRVAGDQAEVVGLTTPGGEPHDLELTVAQTAELADADVTVYLSGFQPAVDEGVEQAGGDRVVDAADYADLLPVEELGGQGSGGELDPHFWLDPVRLAAVAETVEAQLAQAAPDKAEAYAANLEALRADLEELDAALAAGLDDCARDTVVVSHDAFGYLGARYGLDLRAINGLSPDAEPSPAHLRELAELIEAEGITTVFSETLASPEMAQTLAADLDLETAVLDPVEGLGDETADEDYLSLMRANLAALQDANDCR